MGCSFLPVAFMGLGTPEIVIFAVVGFAIYGIVVAVRKLFPRE